MGGAQERKTKKHELSVLGASAANDWVLRLCALLCGEVMRACDVIQPFSALAETASLGLSHANRP
jgi:hypothetical protein